MLCYVSLNSPANKTLNLSFYFADSQLFTSINNPGCFHKLLVTVRKQINELENMSNFVYENLSISDDINLSVF